MTNTTNIYLLYTETKAKQQQKHQQTTKQTRIRIQTKWKQGWIKTNNINKRTKQEYYFVLTTYQKQNNPQTKHEHERIRKRKATKNNKQTGNKTQKKRTQTGNETQQQ